MVTFSLDSELLSRSFPNLLGQFPALYQIVISQGGKIIFERTNQVARENTRSIIFRNMTEAWAGCFKSSPETFRHRIGERFNIRSATKSMMALLTGIAIRDGLISSLDQTLCEFIPDQFTTDIEPRKRAITLRHLLTMTSGLASMESGVNAFKMFSRRNWVHFMLRLPLAGAPGRKFIYNSANPHLLSAVLSKLTGESLLSYANRNLFEPLGIQHVTWGADPQGISFGGGNLFLSALELLRIGELCLQRGNWAGKQIVPQDWFDQMWQPYQEYFPGWNYGYYWYLHEESHAETGRRYQTYSAAGSGGQKIFLIPELDLVLATVAVTDFLGERGIALNQFIGTDLMEAMH
jgi:CubicO group peptidase (beta-lactamase class C family)